MTKFSEWKIDGFTASSSDGKYELWIANGFTSFEDYNPLFPKETLLQGIGYFQRWKIWKELCAERKFRASGFLDN